MKDDKKDGTGDTYGGEVHAGCLCGNLSERDHFEREQMDDNIKVDFTESCLESMDWIYLTMDIEK
jgi:hypothetical protein